MLAHPPLHPATAKACIILLDHQRAEELRHPINPKDAHRLAERYRLDRAWLVRLSRGK